MKNHKVIVAFGIVSFFVTVAGCVKYQKLKSAYWVVYFLNPFSEQSTNHSDKDARYSFVLRDNGNYIISQRKSYTGLIISYFIENQNERLEQARADYGSWLDNTGGGEKILQEELREGLGSGVKIELKRR